jgi:hypothetical protein
VDLEFWRSQLQRRYRNLQKLKEQLALYGSLEAPLRLLNQIEAEEQKIAEIEARLEELAPKNRKS